MAAEFFELFKTPWERAVPRRKYPVVLSTDGAFENLESDLFLVYGSGETEVDRAAGIALDRVSGPVNVEWGTSSFPVYGRLATVDAGISASYTLTSGGK